MWLSKMSVYLTEIKPWIGLTVTVQPKYDVLCDARLQSHYFQDLHWVCVKLSPVSDTRVHVSKNKMSLYLFSRTSTSIML